jgi:mxaJ protein
VAPPGALLTLGPRTPASQCADSTSYRPARPNYGDYTKPNPPAAIIDAVAKGAVDVAVAWGPLAGYFASRSKVPLRIEPAVDSAQYPMTFQIAMGVRRDNLALRDQLNALLEQDTQQISALLQAYNIPQL